MKLLYVDQDCLILRLDQRDPGGPPLVEQARPLLLAHPRVLIDLSGLMLTSMQIGELINLHKTFERIWGNDPHWLGLLNVPDLGRHVLRTVGLEKVFPAFDSLHEALEAHAAWTAEYESSHSPPPA